MSVQQLQQLTAALADRYRVIRELGRGGMATVYVAEDVKHQREVAIKVLLYYVMPYIQEESLRECVSQKGRLPLDEGLSDEAARLPC